jgi:putative nucleotidyltransferase with HDIG domain
MTLPARDQAIALLHDHIQSKYVRQHSRATEAILRELAPRLGADPELWGITGLLHDLDLEMIGDNMTRHGRETVRILQGRFDYPREGLDAILAHNGDVLDIPCRTLFDHAVTAGESITGMVFAMALILPSRQLQDVKPKSVAKRMREPRFAANVSRDRISHHADLGIELVEFCTISVRAMQAIDGQLAEA